MPAKRLAIVSMLLFGACAGRPVSHADEQLLKEGQIGGYCSYGVTENPDGCVVSIGFEQTYRKADNPHDLFGVAGHKNLKLRCGESNDEICGNISYACRCTEPSSKESRTHSDDPS